jgi:2-polyprenyl-3-methyl-5-hydroxy-6-metoxy-1,4-benzoquinol methylase
MQIAEDNCRTGKEFWSERSYYNIPEPRPTIRHQFLFDRYLPRDTKGSVLEIGACPGSNLLALALSHGYRPVALDYLPAVRSLPAAFRKHDVEVEIIEADFLSIPEDRKFDVVMSFGFIEHFNDAEAVLRKHWALVAENGFLMLGLPIFGPMQMILRQLILTPERLQEALRTHYTEIMDMRVIRRWCERLPGASILKCGHLDHMHTWFYSSDAYVRRSRRWILWGWKVASVLPRALNISCRLFSPSGIAIVRRVSPN